MIEGSYYTINPGGVDTLGLEGDANASVTHNVAASSLRRITATTCFAGDSDDIEVHDLSWLDWIIKQVWPNVERMIQNIVKDKIEPEIDKELDKYGVAGRAIKGIHFTSVKLGSQMPILGPARAYRKSRQDFFGIQVDCDVRLDCTPQVEMEVAGFKLGMKRLRFVGTVSMILKPLIDTAPIIGGVQMFLLNRPWVDFELGGHIELLNGNLIHRAIREIVVDQITNALVLPHRVNLNLCGEWEMNTDLVTLNCPLPEGIVRVRVISAKNLTPSDLRLMDFSHIREVLLGKRAKLGSSSDPFCTVRIGAQAFRTPTVKRSLHPQWPAESSIGDFFVYNAHQMASFNIFDDDFGYSKNDFIGRSMVSIEELLSEPQHELPLDGRDQSAINAHPPAPAHRNSKKMDKAGSPQNTKSQMQDASQSDHMHAWAKDGHEGKDLEQSVSVQAKYFSLGPPSSLEAFRRFSKENGGPSQALLGAKVHGLRALGHRFSQAAISGCKVRISLIKSGSSESSMSKPCTFRASSVMLDGVDPALVNVVRNLRMLQPQMSDEEIGEATGMDAAMVRNVLSMHSLLPIEVRAGFYFLCENVEEDVCRIELIAPKLHRKDPITRIAGLEVPLKDLLGQPEMRQSGHFVLSQDFRAKVSEPGLVNSGLYDPTAVAQKVPTANSSRSNSKPEGSRRGLSKFVSRFRRPSVDSHSDSHVEDVSQDGDVDALHATEPEIHAAPVQRFEADMELRLHELVPSPFNIARFNSSQKNGAAR